MAYYESLPALGSVYNWVVFYTANKQGFGHCSIWDKSPAQALLTKIPLDNLCPGTVLMVYVNVFYVIKNAFPWFYYGFT